MSEQLGPLDVEEIKIVRFQFGAELASDGTIVSAAVAVTMKYGADTTPAALCSGSPVVEGRDVLQRVSGVGRTLNAIYHLRCKVVDDAGLTHVVSAELPVKRS